MKIDKNENYYENIITIILVFFVILSQLSIWFQLNSVSHALKLSETRIIYSDYFSFWSAGKMALNGLYNNLYDISEYSKFQKILVDNFDQYLPFPYPPVFLLYVIPFSVFTFRISIILWLAVSIFIYILAIRSLVSRNVIIVYAFCTFSFFNVALQGQSSILFVGLAAWALAFLLRSQHVLAGICIGLLCFKPQLGILFPFALIAARLWRVFFSAAATVVSLVIISIVLFGVNIWVKYFEFLFYFSNYISSDIQIKFQAYGSVYGLIRYFGFNYNMAMIVQMIVTCISILLVIFIMQKKISIGIKYSILIILSILSTPYVLNYDLLLLIIPGCVLYERGVVYGFFKNKKILLLISLLIGYLNMIFGFQFYFFSMAILIYIICYDFRFIKEDERVISR